MAVSHWYACDCDTGLAVVLQLLGLGMGPCFIFSWRRMQRFRSSSFDGIYREAVAICSIDSRSAP